MRHAGPEQDRQAIVHVDPNDVRRVDVERRVRLDAAAAHAEVSHQERHAERLDLAVQLAQHVQPRVGAAVRRVVRRRHFLARVHHRAGRIDEPLDRRMRGVRLIRRKRKARHESRELVHHRHVAVHGAGLNDDRLVASRRRQAEPMHGVVGELERGVDREAALAEVADDDGHGHVHELAVDLAEELEPGRPAPLRGARDGRQVGGRGGGNATRHQSPVIYESNRRASPSTASNPRRERT